MSTTVDDPNLSVYDGSDWKQFTDAPGGWHGGTYHETCDDRDDLTIAFSGTGIQIYGAKRPTYGYYYVEVDGENRRFFNAHSTTDEIPALLFEATNLGDHDHSVWFMNQQNYGTQRSRSCIGVDYIVIQQSQQSVTGAPLPSLTDSASSVEQPPSTITDDLNSTPQTTPSSTTSTEIGVGQPLISSSSSTDNALTVPNLNNFTMAPSAAEVRAPNSTWTGDSMTPVTGVPGLYTGQPLPVSTGQAIKYEGAAPKLQQEVFASAVRAGAISAGHLSLSTPVHVGTLCLFFWSIRRFWAI